MHQALQGFDPDVAQWFLDEVGEPTAVQSEGWPVISRGGDVLLCAPTGMGKTLAAFLWAIDGLMRAAREHKLPQGTSILYLSPLKSLGNDMEKNLHRPLAGIAQRLQAHGDTEVPMPTVAVRTGDTPAAQRRKMLLSPPNILITTPESLFLMLTTPNGRSALRGIRTVIVDELHALMDSKRGVHMVLSLARLAALCGGVQRIGLSATIKPLEEAAHFLAGAKTSGPCPVSVVAPKLVKKTDLQVLCPVPDYRVLPEGTIWPEIFKVAYELAKPVRTTLVFVNSRAIAEKMAHGVNSLAGDGFARTHHGCISKEQRLDAEQKLKRGELRMMCATSSMELGIDVGEVDLVLQISCPKTVARGLQRLGRAGHSPGRVSRMFMIPLTAGDALECALVMRGMLQGEVEETHAPENSIDVLAQHLVSMSCSETWKVPDMLELARTAWPYRLLTEQDLKGTLEMLAGDFEHEADKAVSPRVQYDRIHGIVKGNTYSRMLCLSSGGTIPDRGWYGVYLEDNATRLGELDEVFVYESRVGDRFQLGAFTWQLLRVTRDRVIVRSTGNDGTGVPFWNGDALGRPYELGARMGQRLRELDALDRAGGVARSLREHYAMDADCAANVARLISDQIKLVGGLPNDRLLLIEHFSDETGDARALIHCPLGGRVNLGLALLLQEKLGGGDRDVYVFDGDDGLLVHIPGVKNVPRGVLFELPHENVEEVMARLLPATPLYSMNFRYAAARALMMGVRKGGRQPLWVQRLRGMDMLTRALETHNHPLLIESMRECMGQNIDVPELAHLLRDLHLGLVRVVERDAPTPSPLGSELRRDFAGVMMYEDPVPRGAMKRDLVADMNRVSLEGQPVVPPQAEDVELASQPARAPRDVQELHALMMTEGDLIEGEREVQSAWLSLLAMDGRALPRSPGIWIAMEQRALYAQALDEGDADALQRVVRRCLRFRGAMDASELVARYDLSEDQAEAALHALAERGEIRAYEGAWLHADVFDRASALMIKRRRAAVATQPPERYAALLAGWHQTAGTPQEQLEGAIQALFGMKLPLAHWEETVLPARVARYKPAMLDRLLATGRAVWRYVPGERAMLSFYPPEEIGEEIPEPGELTPEERIVYDALAAGGASFTHSLKARLPGVPVADALRALLERGLLVNDSLAPVRMTLVPATSKRQTVRARVLADDSGRWELARAPREATVQQGIHRLWDQYVIACRETAKLAGVSWPLALDVLRVWEHTGQARRGYYVSGLSGAQFVREEDFGRVCALLAQPQEGYRVLAGVDPALAWGNALAHRAGHAFMLVPGTAAVMCMGEVVLVAERRGEQLRPLSDQEPVLLGALLALAHAFATGGVFGSQRSITVKEFPPDMGALLERAGFLREMLNYVLWRTQT